MLVFRSWLNPSPPCSGRSKLWDVSASVEGISLVIGGAVRAEAPESRAVPRQEILMLTARMMLKGWQHLKRSFFSSKTRPAVRAHHHAPREVRPAGLSVAKRGAPSCLPRQSPRRQSLYIARDFSLNFATTLKVGGTSHMARRRITFHPRPHPSIGSPL